MKHVMIRPLRQEEIPQFYQWLTAGDKNSPDPAAITATSSFTVCAFNENKKILFAPVQVPFFMESLAVNPDATELEQAAAMKAVVQFLVSQAYLQGRVELYFLGSNDGTNTFANNQLFEKVDLPVYRFRLASIEPPNPKG